MKNYHDLQKMLKGCENRISSIKTNFEAMIDEKEENKYNVISSCIDCTDDIDCIDDIMSLSEDSIDKILEYEIDMRNGINSEKKDFIKEVSYLLDIEYIDDPEDSDDFISKMFLIAKEHVNAMLKIEEEHPYNDKDTDDDSKIGISITQEENKHQERFQRERIEREMNELEETFEKREKEKKEREEILKNAKLKLERDEANKILK